MQKKFTNLKLLLMGGIVTIFLCAMTTEGSYRLAEQHINWGPVMTCFAILITALFGINLAAKLWQDTDMPD